ncbi:hypothetical protein EST92_11750 [Streptomyces sp. TM32]|uniref:hypothetical protein n=1 Tax=Streptomyces sp. TM32 TaxID=1652669 RepID=UPI001011C9C6|nr:hypothetical protein [Streptomyces sp. TM32]RXS84225.1 hypothetical protein EST92_11750 [Streptomyces sp. TM32]
MATVFTVLADTKADAAADLTRLCQLLGLQPLGEPSAVLGRGRWMARAVPAERPAGVEQSA